MLPTTFRAERNIQEWWKIKCALRLANTLSHTPVGHHDRLAKPLGFIGYYSRRTYYDYPGLCSRRVVAWLQAHKYPRVFKNLQVYSYLRPDYLVLRKRIEYDYFSKQPEGAFLQNEYHLEREFAVTPEDRAQLFHPERNIDMDFVVLARNRDVQKSETPR